jgi:hypothetical protein
MAGIAKRFNIVPMLRFIAQIVMVLVSRLGAGLTLLSRNMGYLTSPYSFIEFISSENPESFFGVITGLLLTQSCKFLIAIRLLVPFSGRYAFRRYFVSSISLSLGVLVTLPLPFFFAILTPPVFTVLATWGFIEIFNRLRLTLINTIRVSANLHSGDKTFSFSKFIKALSGAKRFLSPSILKRFASELGFAMGTLKQKVDLSFLSSVDIGAFTATGYSTTMLESVRVN